jgi:hypothetical protein
MMAMTFVFFTVLSFVTFLLNHCAPVVACLEQVGKTEDEVLRTECPSLDTLRYKSKEVTIAVVSIFCYEKAFHITRNLIGKPLLPSSFLLLLPTERLARQTQMVLFRFVFCFLFFVFCFLFFVFCFLFLFLFFTLYFALIFSFIPLLTLKKRGSVRMEYTRAGHKRTGLHEHKGSTLCGGQF